MHRRCHQRAVARSGGDLRRALGGRPGLAAGLVANLGGCPVGQGSERLGLPFAGIWQFTQGALQFGAFPLVVRLAALVLVVAAALATAWSLPRSRALPQEKLAWALGLGVAVLLSHRVWVEDWAFLRALVEP